MALVRRLGLASATEHSVHRYLGQHVGRRARPRHERYGWVHARWRPRTRAWTRAYDGHYAIAPCGLEEASCIVLDLDIGHGERKYDRPVTMDDYIVDDTREYCAPRVVSALADIRAAYPDLTVHAIGTPRGAHVLIILDEDVQCPELHAVGQAIRSCITAEYGIEVFPTADGRMCRAPLTGRSRLLGADGETALHRHRARDRQALIDAPTNEWIGVRDACHSGAHFTDLHDQKTNHFNTLSIAIGERGKYIPVTPQTVTKKPRRVSAARVWDDTGGHLHGREYCDRILHWCRNGCERFVGATRRERFGIDHRRNATERSPERRARRVREGQHKDGYGDFDGATQEGNRPISNSRSAEPLVKGRTHASEASRREDACG